MDGLLILSDESGALGIFISFQGGGAVFLPFTTCMWLTRLQGVETDAGQGPTPGVREPKGGIGVATGTRDLSGWSSRVSAQEMRVTPEAER